MTERAASRSIPALAAAYLAFAAMVVATGLDRFELCPTKLWLGFRCPLCGLTRSVGELMALDPGAAWRLHPLGFVALPVLLMLAAGLVAPARVRGRWLAERGEARGAAIGGGVLLAVVGLLREL